MTRHDPPEVARARFFEAAMDLWAEKGYHAARMDEIAARAGRSKGSLYHHFESKQELLLAIVEALVGEVQGDVEQGLEEASSAEELLRGLIDHYAASFEEDPRLVPVFLEFMAISSRDEDVRDLFTRHYRRVIDSFERVFAWGVSSGEFRADLDTARIARTFAFAGDGLALVDAMVGGEGQLREGLTGLCDLVLRGVLARR